MRKAALIIFPLAFILVFLGSSAFISDKQSKKAAGEGPVNWMSFEEAVEKSKKEKRKIFIDVYTDWCGWCKVMDKNTFSQPVIAKYIKIIPHYGDDMNFNFGTYILIFH